MITQCPHCNEFVREDTRCRECGRIMTPRCFTCSAPLTPEGFCVAARSSTDFGPHPTVAPPPVEAAAIQKAEKEAALFSCRAAECPWTTHSNGPTDKDARCRQRNHELEHGTIFFPCPWCDCCYPVVWRLFDHIRRCHFAKNSPDLPAKSPEGGSWASLLTDVIARVAPLMMDKYRSKAYRRACHQSPRYIAIDLISGLQKKVAEGLQRRSLLAEEVKADGVLITDIEDAIRAALPRPTSAGRNQDDVVAFAAVSHDISESGQVEEATSPTRPPLWPSTPTAPGADDDTDKDEHAEPPPRCPSPSPLPKSPDLLPLPDEPLPDDLVELAQRHAAEMEEMREVVAQRNDLKRRIAELGAVRDQLATNIARTASKMQLLLVPPPDLNSDSE